MPAPHRLSPLRLVAGFRACLVLLALCLMTARPVLGAEPAANALGLEAPVVAEATLTIWNRPITTLRATYNGVAPVDRVARISTRVANLSSAELAQPLRTEAVDREGSRGYLIFAGSDLIMGLGAADLDQQETLDQVVPAVVDRLTEVFAARLAQRQADVVLFGVLWSVVATLGLSLIHI
jgi:hypothetical protein